MLGKQALQSVGDQAHGLHIGLARALVAAQQAQVVQRTPELAALQHARELGQAAVEVGDVAEDVAYVLVGKVDREGVAAGGVGALGGGGGRGWGR